jgi:hypothetical protein
LPFDFQHKDQVAKVSFCSASVKPCLTARSLVVVALHADGSIVVSPRCDVFGFRAFGAEQLRDGPIISGHLASWMAVKM